MGIFFPSDFNEVLEGTVNMLPQKLLEDYPAVAMESREVITSEGKIEEVNIFSYSEVSDFMYYNIIATYNSTDGKSVFGISSL